MKVRQALLLVVVAACSGGDEPAVEIEVVTATCRTIDSGIVVDAELDATLGVGESLEILVESDVGVSRISEVWDCGVWQFSSPALGCIREVEIQAAQQVVTVMHTQIFDAGEPPTQIVLSPVLVVDDGGHIGTAVDLTCAP